VVAPPSISGRGQYVVMADPDLAAMQFGSQT